MVTHENKFIIFIYLGNARLFKRWVTKWSFNNRGTHVQNAFSQQLQHKGYYLNLNSTLLWVNINKKIDISKGIFLLQQRQCFKSINHWFYSFLVKFIETIMVNSMVKFFVLVPDLLNHMIFHMHINTQTLTQTFLLFKNAKLTLKR